MTETIDQLIQTRFDAVTSPIDDGDWNDVLARARKAEPSRPARRVPRRVALAAAVVAVAVTVTAVAFGLPHTVVDFFTSPPAPHKVKNFFGAENVGAPPGMSPQAIPGQARKIMSARFDVTGKHFDHPASHTLYVAPRKGGGFCYLWTNYDGGCADPENATKSVTHPVARPLGVAWLENDYAVVVSGWVRTGATKTVEARFADGSTETIPVTWVSAPIDAAFFVYPVPLAHQTRADALTSVVALDEAGKAVGRQDFRLTKPLDQDVVQTLPDGTRYSLPRRADAARARKIISFRSTKGNEIYLWTMPRAGGGTCYLFNRGRGCNPTDFMANIPGALNGGLSGGANPVLFFAETKPDVAAIELRYQNGETARLTPLHGFVLTEISPAHYRQGTRLAAAVALDRSGNVIYTQREQPQTFGLYPCRAPTDLGYGVKACP